MKTDSAGRARLVISLVACAVSVTLLSLILLGDVSFYVVPTASMEPTLHPNDRIVAIASSKYGRGQVVVVRDPERPGEYLVKRIVGISGDRIAVLNGQLMVNGRAISEPYLSEPMEYQMSPMLVGSQEVFLLGDNRNESEDSHLWKRGVPESDIMGAVRYIYSPGERRGARVAYPEVFQGIAHAKNAETSTGQTEPGPR